MKQYYAITSSSGNGATEATLFIPPEDSSRIIPELIWITELCRAKDLRFIRYRVSKEWAAYVSFLSEGDATDVCTAFDQAIKEHLTLGYAYFMRKSSELKNFKKEIAPVTDYIKLFGGDFGYGLYNLRNDLANHTADIPDEAVKKFEEFIAPYNL